MLRMLSRPVANPDPSETIIKCVTQLQGLAGSQPSTFSQVTRSQIVAAHPDDTRLSTTFYFSAHDLWRHFVRTGEREVLDSARDAAYLAYFLSKESVHKRNALLSWTIISAIDAMPIANLKEVLDEISEICGQEGYSPDILRMTTLILEAHVGLVKSFRRSKDTETAEQLLQTNQPKLQALHDDYRRRTPEIPDSRKADEQEAWNSLLAAFPLPSREEVRGHGNAILVHPDLASAIQTGAHAGVYAFVDHHYQSIQDQLQARLAVRFTPENALYPEGRRCKAVISNWRRPCSVAFRKRLTVGHETSARISMPTSEASRENLPTHVESFGTSRTTVLKARRRIGTMPASRRMTSQTSKCECYQLASRIPLTRSS
jgi:hypothetical protein